MKIKVNLLRYRILGVAVLMVAAILISQTMGLTLLRALTVDEIISGQVLGSVTYPSVKLTSAGNKSLTVTATPVSFSSGKWTYKFDWTRVRNAKGSLYITLKSKKTNQILKLDTTAKTGSQTATLEPLVAYRFEFYSQPEARGSVLLRKFFTSMGEPEVAVDPAPVGDLPDPVPLPPPVNANNTVTISDKSGQSQVNYPVQIGRPFKHGEIKEYPGVAVNGAAVFTQADVKNRWPDGSVKFAILSFMLPNLPANSSLTLTFSNQTSGNNTPLSKEQMLGANFNFNAQIKIAKNAVTKVADARSMLAAGDYTVWTSGPVATTILLADHSSDRKYDIGFDAYKSFRPIFEAVFWPATNQVRVRYIGENSNTKTLQDIQYDVTLTLGQSATQSVYSRTGLTHPMLTRWTKVFWLNKIPEPKINIDNNLAYLSQTSYFPVYDTTVRVSDSSIAGAYDSWQKNPHDLYDSGGWTKYMPTTGGRPEISPFTNWTMRWLYSGDWRAREVALGMGDLAGAWRLNAREGDVTKKIDKAQTISGLGLPISVYAYPNLWLPDNNGSYGQLAMPNVTIVSNDSYGWVPDNAHQPDPFFAQYVLTGDHWYLEEAQMWASMSAVANCPGSAQWCRGPGMAGLQDQVRGDAWAFRNRMNAAFITPDDTKELKSFYTQMVNDVLAFWEGKAGITGTKLQDMNEWKWANLNTYKVARTNPLHFWSIDGAPPYYFAPWQQYYFLTVLGMARERGFAAGALFDFLSPIVTKQITAASYNPYNLAAYSIKVSDATGNWYPTWAEVQAANIASGSMKASGDFSVTNDGAYYAILATTASSFMTTSADGLRAWNFLKDAVKQGALKNSPTVPGWYKGYYDGSGELGWNIIPR